jgi:hypothetical protein
VTTHGRHGTVVAGAPRRPGPSADLLATAGAYAASAAATLADALTAVPVAFASEPGA